MVHRSLFNIEGKRQCWTFFSWFQREGRRSFSQKDSQKRQLVTEQLNTAKNAKVHFGVIGAILLGLDLRTHHSTTFGTGNRPFQISVPGYACEYQHFSIWLSPTPNQLQNTPFCWETQQNSLRAWYPACTPFLIRCCLLVQRVPRFFTTTKPVIKKKYEIENGYEDKAYHGKLCGGLMELVLDVCLLVLLLSFQELFWVGWSHAFSFQKIKLGNERSTSSWARQLAEKCISDSEFLFLRNWESWISTKKLRGERCSRFVWATRRAGFQGNDQPCLPREENSTFSVSLSRRCFHWICPPKHWNLAREFLEKYDIPGSIIRGIQYLGSSKERWFQNLIFRMDSWFFPEALKFWIEGLPAGWRRWRCDFALYAQASESQEDDGYFLFTVLLPLKKLCMETIRLSQNPHKHLTRSRSTETECTERTLDQESF